MAESDVKRMSEAAVLEHGTNNNVEIVDPTKGFNVELNVGDTFTCGDLFLTTMGKSVLDEDGVSFAKGVYWVSEAKLKHGKENIEFDAPAALFVRCTGCRDVAQLGETYKKVATSSVETPIVKGHDLFTQLMREAKLSEEQRIFNEALARAESSRTKLRSVKGKTLKVIAKSRKVYALSFNRKNEENWGSKPGHWRSVEVLFFEEVKSTKKN